MKKTLIGITGSIAAFKSLELIRLLRKNDHEVEVIMTPDSQAFITPLSVASLSGRQVHTNWIDDDLAYQMKHIKLARWADQLIIYPATAHALAQMAYGFADHLLLGAILCFEVEKPRFIAPAMNASMFNNPIVQDNCSRLKQNGWQFLAPQHGELACGEIGTGHVMLPDDALKYLS